MQREHPTLPCCATCGRLMEKVGRDGRMIECGEGHCQAEAPEHVRRQLAALTWRRRSSRKTRESKERREREAAVQLSKTFVWDAIDAAAEREGEAFYEQMRRVAGLFRLPGRRRLLRAMTFVPAAKGRGGVRQRAPRRDGVFRENRRIRTFAEPSFAKFGVVTPDAGTLSCPDFDAAAVCDGGGLLGEVDSLAWL